MKQIVPCLWYDGDAEEAAAFYTSLLPDSRINRVVRSPADTPSGKEGSVLVVDFTLAGQPYTALNGGPAFRFTEAISLQVHPETQEETDRLWDALTANGGEESMCGWLKDRWGLSWQISPVQLLEAVMGPDRARAKRAMEAMMTMRKIDIAAIERAANGA